jgi:hypothetical protein
VQLHTVKAEPDIGKQPGIVELLRRGLDLRLAYGYARNQTRSRQQFRLARACVTRKHNAVGNILLRHKRWKHKKTNDKADEGNASTR